VSLLVTLKTSNLVFKDCCVHMLPRVQIVAHTGLNIKGTLKQPDVASGILTT
jgi:hypothetical protein